MSQMWIRPHTSFWTDLCLTKSRNYQGAIVFSKCFSSSRKRKAFSNVFKNSSGLISVLEKLRFRGRFVWTVGPTVKWAAFSNFSGIVRARLAAAVVVVGNLLSCSCCYWKPAVVFVYLFSVTVFFFFRLQETLDLSNNKFSHFSCNVEMVWTGSLKRLNLSNNTLRTISWNVCQLSGLQDLDLSNNALRCLPKPEFWTTTTLHKLNLAFNKVMSDNRVFVITVIFIIIAVGLVKLYPLLHGNEFDKVRTLREGIAH